MTFLGVTTATLLTITSIFATSPNSTNFTLKSYDLGGSGGGSSSSSNYRLNGEVGGQSGSTSTSSNYIVDSGEKPTKNANVPPAPTLTNPSNNEYIRLRLVINNGGNPSDTKFAIAISSDNFVSTQYVKSDNSISASLALTDYQTYASWGGASGFWITGLTSNTTYKVKVKAMQGAFTETQYGPATSGVATVTPTISFSVTTSPASGPPPSVSFSSLNPGSVFNAGADSVLTLSTNALSGGLIYVKDANAGLNSLAGASSIPSVTANLSSANSGYGAVVTNTSQSSGGPMTATSPFNGVSDNVGALSTILQTIATTPSPVTTGAVTVTLKAKTDITVPSATDYADVVTFIASMAF